MHIRSIYHVNMVTVLICGHQRTLFEATKEAIGQTRHTVGRTSRHYGTHGAHRGGSGASRDTDGSHRCGRA
jgi:hypothetical protein